MAINYSEENYTPAAAGMSIEAPKYPTDSTLFSNPMNQTNANKTVAPTTPAKSPVLSLSTDNAISQVNKDTQRLAELEKITTPKTTDDSQLFAPAEIGILPTEKPIETPKEKPTPGYTLEESIKLFGNDFTGLTQQEDGTFKADASALSRLGITGVKSDTTTTSEEMAISEFDQQMEDLASEIKNYNVNEDPEFATQTAAIKAQYDKLRADMAKVNNSREAQLSTMGLRKGTARYAGEISMGILGEEIKQGSERIQEINRQEGMAIANARKALKDEKFNQLNQQLNIVDTLRANKIDALDRQEKKIAEAAKVKADADKQDLEVLKYQASLMSEDMKDYEYAVNKGFKGDIFDYKAKVKASEAGPEKPMVVSAGSSIYDPTTGEFLGTAPKPLDTGAPEIKEWGGEVHQWNPQTMSWENLGSKESVGGSEAVSWANLITSGGAKLNEVPAEQRAAVVGVLSKLPPKQEDVTATEEKISDLNRLLTHGGLNSAVGTSFLTRGNKLNIWDRLTGNTQDFIGSVQQLLSSETLKSLIDAKAQGATFGALSEGELKILTESASKIGKWAIKDKEGDIVGYNTSEKSFKDEINKIKQNYQDLLDKTTKSQETSKTPTDIVNDFYSKADETTLQALDEMISKNATDEQIIKAFGLSPGFKQGSGGTPIATVLKTPNNTNGGQCGRFVNKITGLGVGDSYESKMAKMDKTIKKPAPGMVFTMPYKDTGHIGFIVRVIGNNAVVKDSNWSLNEKVKTHTIPISEMTGFRRV